ncbi:MAG: hypothetical protein AAF086_00865 [Planctomycetota bacterium]
MRYLLPRVASNECNRVTTSMAFAEMIIRERSRADRNCEPFAMTVFRIHPTQASRRSMNTLVRLLRQHLRLTDDLGWYAPWILGVLLPHTPEGGAQRYRQLIEDMARKANLVGVESAVFVYPDAWLDEAIHDLARFNEIAALGQSSSTHHTLYRPRFTTKAPVRRRDDVQGSRNPRHQSAGLASTKRSSAKAPMTLGGSA